MSSRPHREFTAAGTLGSSTNRAEDRRQEPDCQRPPLDNSEPLTRMFEPSPPPLAPAFANAIARLTGKALR